MTIRITAASFNANAVGRFPAHIGVVITEIGDGQVRAELPIASHTIANNGYMHAGGLVTLADTTCGCGCLSHLPEGASGFTTIELKSNHLGTARDGTVDCVATAVHLGRSTHVWDAILTHRETGRKLALFRCTQMILQGK
jgi:uncharacterized protein (TIGR00369 family)